MVGKYPMRIVHRGEKKTSMKDEDEASETWEGVEEGVEEEEVSDDAWR